jgi:hypothetical protein
MEEAQQSNGGYEQEGVIWHQHSNYLLIKLMELLPKEIPIIDIGCGHNFYASILNYCGYKAIGIDTTDLGSKYFKKGDVTKPIKIKGNHNVISFEVGEHIPKDYEQIFINNLCKHSKKYIILSWAVLGQGGDGHVNCQNNDYIINEMFNRNYTLNLEYTNSLREKINLFWFRDTLMVFEKNT